MKPPNNDIIPQGYRMTELGALPEEWEVVRLGEYCKVFSGYAFKSDDFCNNGVLVVKIGNLQNGSIVFNTKESFFPREKINDDISKYILNEGDILIALTGATTGKISLVPKSVNGALLNQRVGKFSIYNDSLYKSFVMYYVMTDEFQNHIKKNILQSAQGNISPKQIETFSIPLPPLPEQQKIAAVPSAVQEAKEKTEAVITATKALKKSMMKHLFTYGPVSPEEAENVQLKETEIGPVPEDWEVVKFDSCINKQNSKLEKIKKQEYNLYGRYPVIDQGQDLIAGYWDNEKDVYKKNLPVIIFGDHTRIIKYIDFPFVTGADGTKILVPNTSVVFPRFFYYSLLNLKIPSRGYNRHYSLLRDFKIPLPPLPIQQKIASILSAIDAKIEAEENKKKALEKLFKTLLDNLMTAKIRVNHLEVPS